MPELPKTPSCGNRLLRVLNYCISRLCRCSLQTMGWPPRGNGTCASGNQSRLLLWRTHFLVYAIVWSHHALTHRELSRRTDAFACSCPDYLSGLRLFNGDLHCARTRGVTRSRNSRGFGRHHLQRTSYAGEWHRIEPHYQGTGRFPVRQRAPARAGQDRPRERSGAGAGTTAYPGDAGEAG